MKKTYINPEIEVVKISAPVIMAGSPVSFDNAGGGSVTLSDEDFEEGEDVVLSRGFDW